MRKVSIGEAVIVASEVFLQLRDYCHKIEIVGSLREKASVVDEIELLVVPKDAAEFREVVQKVFPTVIAENELEIQVVYDSMSVTLTKVTGANYNVAFEALVKEAA